MEASCRDIHFIEAPRKERCPTQGSMISIWSLLRVCQNALDVLIQRAVVPRASHSDATPLKCTRKARLPETQIFLMAKKKDVHFSEMNGTPLLVVSFACNLPQLLSLWSRLPANSQTLFGRFLRIDLSPS
jgi:hypothetical protein